MSRELPKLTKKQRDEWAVDPKGYNRNKRLGVSIGMGYMVGAPLGAYVGSTMPGAPVAQGALLGLGAGMLAGSALYKDKTDEEIYKLTHKTNPEYLHPMIRRSDYVLKPKGGREKRSSFLGGAAVGGALGAGYGYTRPTDDYPKGSPERIRRLRAGFYGSVGGLGGGLIGKRIASQIAKSGGGGGGGTQFKVGPGSGATISKDPLKNAVDDVDFLFTNPRAKDGTARFNIDDLKAATKRMGEAAKSRPDLAHVKAEMDMHLKRVTEPGISTEELRRRVKDFTDAIKRLNGKS
jgi:hypothetical protein